MPAGLSGEDRSHDGGTGPAPETGTVIVNIANRNPESGETGCRAIRTTGATGESERFDRPGIGRRSIGRADRKSGSLASRSTRDVTPVTVPRESREHVRTVPASRRDVSCTYVKLAIIIVAPKKHKTHGLSELDDVGIENGNDHPGTGGARGDRPARRAIRPADWSDWPVRGVPSRHVPAPASRRPWRPELRDAPLFRNAAF